MSYNEIAEANRRAFETQLENAKVFLAKLNHKKVEELKEWRKKFDAMQKLSTSSLGTNSNYSVIIKNIKKRTRRHSAWDLGTHQSCFPTSINCHKEIFLRPCCYDMLHLAGSPLHCIAIVDQDSLKVVSQKKCFHGTTCSQFCFQ